MKKTLKGFKQRIDTVLNFWKINSGQIVENGMNLYIKEDILDPWSKVVVSMEIEWCGWFEIYFGNHIDRTYF